MESINKGYIALKGFAIAISMGLLVYIVLNGVRLAERYVEAKEIEARYFVPDSRPDIMVDKEEKVLYFYNREIGRFEKPAK